MSFRLFVSLEPSKGGERKCEMLQTETFTDQRKQELYGDLVQSIFDRNGRSQIHLIPWWEDKENRAETEARGLSRNLGARISASGSSGFLGAME